MLLSDIWMQVAISKIRDAQCAIQDFKREV